MKCGYIEFKIEHQRITRTDTFHVVGGSQNYLHARFTFCEDWSGEEAYAIFTAGGKSYRKKIVDGECCVPWEVLLHKRFYVGCEAGDRITSDAVAVDVCACGAPDSIPGKEPSPTLQKQINDLRDKVDDLEKRTPAQGEPGKDGVDGAPGADGKTPVKGVDYFTPEDVQEVAEQAAKLVEAPDTYSRQEIDTIMRAYIDDIDTLLGGDA